MESRCFGWENHGNWEICEEFIFVFKHYLRHGGISWEVKGWRGGCCYEGC